MGQGRERLDVLLVKRGFFSSREQARRAIMAGEVQLGEDSILKPGMRVSEDAEIVVHQAEHAYVSRGGYKLEKALDTFGISPEGKVAIDIGASTGGFTDCLLQRGVLRVYAIDVGYGQLAWKLRQDPRVIVMERTNIRYVTPGDIGEEAHLAVMDTSFISITKFLEVVVSLLADDGQVVALIKPQFEAGRELVGKGGVVKDKKVHIQVIDQIVDFVESIDLKVNGLTYSPITGPKGNIEFLIHLLKSSMASAWDRDESDKVVEEAHNCFSSQIR